MAAVDIEGCWNPDHRYSLTTMRSKNRKVRFVDDSPETIPCRDNSGSFEKEDAERAAWQKDLIWYNRSDYRNFLRERIATVQVLRSVQGDLSADLEGFYCSRGLEPYQSAALQMELMAHRSLYVQVVLEEQALVKEYLLHHAADGCTKSSDLPISDLAVHLTQRLAPMSQWAVQRARNLAILDEREALRILHDVSSSHVPKLNERNDNWVRDKRRRSKRRESLAETSVRKRPCPGRRWSLQSNVLHASLNKASINDCVNDKAKDGPFVQAIPKDINVTEPTKKSVHGITSMESMSTPFSMDSIPLHETSREPALSSQLLPPLSSDILWQSNKIPSTMNSLCSKMNSTCRHSNKEKHERSSDPSDGQKLSLHSLLRQGSSPVQQLWQSGGRARKTELSRRLLQGNKFQLLRRDSLTKNDRNLDQSSC